MMIKKGFVIGIIILLLAGGLTSVISINLKNTVKKSINGNTLYVGGDGPGNYTNIQDAIDDASDNDTVFVYDDSSPYYENIEIYKSIDLMGEDKNTTIIDGKKIEDVIFITTSGVNISRFTIINSSSTSPYAGIRGDYYSKYNNIIDNIISNNYQGISLPYSNNYTIIGNTISNNKVRGINIRHSQNTVVNNNIIISNRWEGLFLEYTSGNKIFSNSFFDDGIRISITYNNIIFNNTVNGKPLVYLENKSDIIVDLDAGQVILINCNNITVQNQKISNTDQGIQLLYTHNCSISDNKIFDNPFAISITDSSNNSITNNNIYSCSKHGIRLMCSDKNFLKDNFLSNNHNSIDIYKSKNNIVKDNNIWNNDKGVFINGHSSINTIIDNKIWNNYYGIHLTDSNENIIVDNSINSNDDGIHLWYSDNNSFIGNNFFLNDDAGIELSYSNNNTIIGNNFSNKYYGLHMGGYNNTIYHNNFINHHNTVDFYNNTWDNGYPSGGNFWHDYNGMDIDGDGIGDTPYPIPGGDNIDRYPLMYPTANFPPFAPIISGPSYGKSGIDYEYSFNTTDVNKDPVMYYIDWGDDTIEWTGYCEPGASITLKHNWTQNGNYNIIAKAVDIWGAESEWSEPLVVKMPRDKTINNMVLRFLENHPFLYQVLQLILQKLGL